MKDGAVIHQERIIIGKPDTQTPVFSNAMRRLCSSPNGACRPRSRSMICCRSCRTATPTCSSGATCASPSTARRVDPGSFNWDKVDIRRYPIVPGPGAGNPLGSVKFLFPNKHDVYMHDTPTTACSSTRCAPSAMAASACAIRDDLPSRDPGRGQGLGAGRDVEALLDNWKKPNNRLTWTGRSRCTTSTSRLSLAKGGHSSSSTICTVTTSALSKPFPACRPSRSLCPIRRAISSASWKKRPRPWSRKPTPPRVPALKPSDCFNGVIPDTSGLTPPLPSSLSGSSASTRCAGSSAARRRCPARWGGTRRSRRRRAGWRGRRGRSGI